MMRQPNKVLRWMQILALLLSILVPAYGAEIDHTQRCSLTVRFYDSDRSRPVPGVNYQLYRVGDISENGVITWTSEVRDYRISLSHTTSDGWDGAAQALAGYLGRDGIPPLHTGTTDSDGTVTWTDLTLGLYLAIGARTVLGSDIYTTSPFLTALPGLEGTEWNYDVTVSPKFQRTTPPPPGPSTVTRRVLKVWEDDGRKERRPESITVQLVHNNTVYDTQILNEENNWRYTWTGLSDAYEWTVVEQVVPKDYTVSTGREGITILITNTYEEPPPPPSETPPPTPPTTPPSEPPGEEEEIPEETPPLAPPPEEEEEIPDDEVPLLPNTGLLWWPVPLLLCGGLTCIGAGVVAHRSEENKQKR